MSCHRMLRTAMRATSICLQNIFNSGIQLVEPRDSCTHVAGVSRVNIRSIYHVKKVGHGYKSV